MALQSPESFPVVLDCFSRLTFAKKKNCEYICNLYGSKHTFRRRDDFPDMQQLVVNVFDCASLFAFAYTCSPLKVKLQHFVCHHFY